MDWIEKHTDEYEEFWHVTSRDKIDSISKNGIIKSIIGENGEGVYCVKKTILDRTQIDNVISFMERNGYDREDLYIVEFEYLGDMR